MFDPKKLEEIVKNFGDAIPERFKSLKSDMERAFRSSMQAGFSKLDLVTREEFDVQASVLAKTRAKVDELQKKITELEKYLIKDGGGAVKAKSKSSSKATKEPPEQ
jgi:BMFP domain-containing protein YqiC